ncbi:MAG: hypothetical protein B7C24_10645 [Bacteroidetes bacterium 4572_77]|nr:MAG: hypothetical protein B7C24_10645 [Bacteroidetes bacterium 4572_77]
MKPMSLFSVLLLTVFLFQVPTFAQTSPVSDYIFGTQMSSYSEISGGVIHGSNLNDDESFNAIDLGFTFNYNATDYTQVSIQSNGYLAMGSSVIETSTPLSDNSGSDNVIAALLHLKSKDNGELMSKMEGSSPNRVFIVQWKNYQRDFDGLDEMLNFQIRLYETSNSIELIYGAINLDDYSNAYTFPQVGLRGITNTDFNSRHSNLGDGKQYPWNRSISSINAGKRMAFHGGRIPQEGFSFVWKEAVSLDASINAISQPAEVFTNPGTQNILVELKNCGTTTLNSATIKWQIADGAINSYSWSGSLAQGDSESDVNIGSFDFQDPIVYPISVWIENPNAGVDQNTTNDLSVSYKSLNTYCTANLGYTEWYYLEDFFLADILHYNCSDYDAPYTDFSPYYVAQVAPGSQFNWSAEVVSGGKMAFWLDLNNDGDWEDDEEFLGLSDYFDYSQTFEGSIVIPASASEGYHKLRVRYFVGTAALEVNADDACAPISNWYGEGDAQDYAVNNTYATDILEANTNYQWKIIAKNEFGDATNCDVWTFATGEDLDYCIPGFADCDEWGDMLNDFIMEDIVHLNTGCSPAGYADFTDISTDLIQGGNITWSAEYGSQDALAIWIDLDDDGVFNETDEFVYFTPDLVQFGHTETGDFTLPPNSPLGEHRMRVRVGYGMLEFTGDQSCSTIGYSETHDYTVNIVEPNTPPDCAFNPSPENAATNVFLNTWFSWEASGATSYDVYFGTTSLDYIGEVNEAQFDPGTLLPYTIYQWKIVPKNSAGSAQSCDIWTFETNDELEYCMLLYYDNPDYNCSWGDDIDDFSVGDLEHLNTGCNGTDGMAVDYTNMVAHLEQGSSYGWTVSIEINEMDYFGIWLDVDNDGEFTAAECLYISDGVLPSGESYGNLQIPVSASLGNHRMRLRVAANIMTAEDACTWYQFGEAHDYTVEVMESTNIPDCAINPFPANGSTNTPPNLDPLSWSADYASGFDVYFGADSNPPLVSSDQAETQYNTGVLQANTSYFWKIIPHNSNGGPDDCDVWSFTTASELDFCTDLYAPGAEYNCTWGDYIDDLMVGDFEHLATGCSEATAGYADYSHMEINLARNNTFEWTLTNANPNYNHFAIWIDYNDDGDFNNTNEFLYTSENLLPETYSGEITIAANAVLGEHRMRFRLKSSDPPMNGNDACTFYNFGETHDYTVLISLYDGIENIENTSQVLVYPNPASQMITLESNAFVNQISIFNAYGEQVFLKDEYKGKQIEMEVSDLAAGVYLLKIETDTETVKKRVVIAR